MEPSFGLAPIAIAALGEVIRQLNGKGVSILLVEQNARLALGLASTGYVLVSGEVVCSGSTRDLSNSDIVKETYLGQMMSGQAV